MFDQRGRATRKIQNYVDGDPRTGNDDEDQTVDITYTPDGHEETIIARQKNADDDQQTRYVYGTTLNDSDIARSDLLRAVIYPDSDDTHDPLGDGPDGIYDRVEHCYNRQGEIRETKLQSETMHQILRDKLGRQVHDCVVTLGAGVDGTVRRISTTYNVLGSIDSISSHDHPTPGSGMVLNEVTRKYDDLGILVEEFQEHDGPVNGNTPSVGYNYQIIASGGEIIIGPRLGSLRYPNGRHVHFTYGDAGSDDDHLNRLHAIHDDDNGSTGAALATYTYLGLQQFVHQALPEPQIVLDYIGAVSGTYAGLDRFDRVIDQRWINEDTNEDVDRFQYGYDRASSRIWRENTVSKSQSTPVYLDEFYTYDGLHRLKTMDCGELNATKTGVTGTPAREEDWSLDPLGNWSGYVQKTSGTTDLDQSRTVNKVNEIIDISETTGPSWVTPAYDRNGNMTTIPKPADPADLFVATYDAWNRLMRIEQEVVGPVTLKVAEYAYDGVMRRTEKATFTAGILASTRHFYYTLEWQAIEERVDSSTAPDRQFIWGPLYIDHLLLRDRDTSTPADGGLNERTYSLQDANWNTVALSDVSGGVIERYAYDPYGETRYLNSTHVKHSVQVSAFEQMHEFTGRYRDAEVGLYHFRHRYYACNFGHFLTRDLSGYEGGYHLYNYGGNAPHNTLDPSGLDWTSLNGPGRTAVSITYRSAGASVSFTPTSGGLWATARGTFYADLYRYASRRTVRRYKTARWTLNLPFGCTVSSEDPSRAAIADTFDLFQFLDSDTPTVPGVGGALGPASGGMSGSYHIDVASATDNTSYEAVFLGPPPPSGVWVQRAECQVKRVVLHARWIKEWTWFLGMARHPFSFTPGDWVGNNAYVVAEQRIGFKVTCCLPCGDAPPYISAKADPGDGD